MKVALSTQRVTPVHPGKPLYTQAKESTFREQKESANFKEALNQAYSNIQEKTLTERYQVAMARALERYSDKPIAPEVSSYHISRKGELTLRQVQPPRTLDLTV